MSALIILKQTNDFWHLEDSKFCMRTIKLCKIVVFLCRVSVELTWAECVAGDLLHRHALAESPAVERRRVSTGSRSLLDTPPTWHITGWPLCPQGPAAVHCREFNKVRGEEVERVHNKTFLTTPAMVQDSNKSGVINDYAGSARHQCITAGADWAQHIHCGGYRAPSFL